MVLVGLGLKQACCTLNPSAFEDCDMCIDGQEFEWRCASLPVQTDTIIGVMVLSTESNDWSTPTEWGDVVACWYKKPICGTSPGTCAWEPETLVFYCREQPQPTTELDCAVDSPQEPD